MSKADELVSILRERLAGRASITIEWASPAHHAYPDSTPFTIVAASQRDPTKVFWRKYADGVGGHDVPILIEEFILHMKSELE